MSDVLAFYASSDGEDIISVEQSHC
jgi:hypothetical protein